MAVATNWFDSHSFFCVCLFLTLTYVSILPTSATPKSPF